MWSCSPPPRLVVKSDSTFPCPFFFYCKLLEERDAYITSLKSKVKKVLNILQFLVIDVSGAPLLNASESSSIKK